jgi:hypothetical protein
VSAVLVHALLAEWEVPHAFGTKGAPEPERLVRPRQVHGRAVARIDDGGAASPHEADAIVTSRAGARIGVVTADCVPILVASEGGSRVAAVHAGWRGLAAGVIDAALAALAHEGEAPGRLRAAIGPCIGACCYEIDAPVVAALAPAFEPALSAALAPSGPGRHHLDLVALARHALTRGGLPPAAIGAFAGTCTRCETERFHSYRRDGPRAGRLLHWIEARGRQG